MAAIPVNFVVIFGLFTVIFYLLGLHNFLTRNEENACEMTYMFEFPQYVEISLHPDIQRKYPRYALYAYSEGALTHDLRRMKFKGVPVLFIPGNSGSHKQGRSLASIALRRAISLRSPYHFNFFLVDFSEDLSGLYGGVLEDETDFVRLAIKKILSLYPKESPYRPESVVLFGHSVGGIIAKNVLTSPDFEPELVRLIITLSTPHQSPALVADPYVRVTYNEISKVWNPRTQNVSHVTLVALGGGSRDIVVRSDLTKDISANVSVVTTAVPGVWCSMDHLSVTWCKQLIMTLIRGLFDSVDPRTRQIMKDQEELTTIFKYHLLQRSAGKKYSSHVVRTFFESNVRWLENLQRQFSVIEKKGVNSPHYVMIRLLDDPKHAEAVIEAVNLNVKEWVYTCVANHFENDFRICEEGISLSNLTEIIPSQSRNRRKIVRLDLMDYKEKGFTHVVVRFPPLDSFMQVNIDVHNPNDRSISYQVPRIYSTSREVILDSTPDNAVHYVLSFSGFEQVWQAYDLTLEQLTCKTAVSHAVILFSVPWANETQPFYLVNSEKVSAVLKLITPRPPKVNRTTAPRVYFILDPSCKYRISIAPNWLAVAGQMARYYSHLLPGYIVAVLFLTLRRQLLSLEEGNGIPLFHNALAQSVRKYYIILQVTIIGSRVVAYSMVAALVPTPDPLLLHEVGLDFFLLQIFLFLVAVGVTYILGALMYAGIIISGQAAHKLAFSSLFKFISKILLLIFPVTAKLLLKFFVTLGRFLARTVTGVVSWSEWIFSALHQLPFAAAALIVSLSGSTVGGLGIVLASAFYFLTLCKLYEDYLEDLFKLSMKFVGRTIKKMTNRGSTSETKPPSVIEAGEGEKVSTENNELNKEEIPVDGGVSEGESSAPAILDNSEILQRVEEVTGHVLNVENEISTLEQIHFQITVCLLYLLAACSTVPSVLAWSRSFHQSSRLIKDPAWAPGIILPAAGCLLWQGGVPRSNRTTSHVSSVILYLLAASSIMFGSVTLYRLPYFITFGVLYLCIHQIDARWLSTLHPDGSRNVNVIALELVIFGFTCFLTMNQNFDSLKMYFQ